MERRSVVKAQCSFRAVWTWCREKCLGPDIRGGFGQARALGLSAVREGKGWQMHWGRGQQGLPIQGRMSSEEILEWALDPESS